VIVNNNNDCKPEVKCEPIPYTITPPSKVDCENFPFYGKPVSFKFEVEIPKIVETCRETWRFETINIILPCCTVYACVPCEKVFTKTKECKKVKRLSELEASRREDGTIDVYVLNVPGMPSKYVERLRLSQPEYIGLFGTTTPVPVYP
jgi:hypothetical protein